MIVEVHNNIFHDKKWEVAFLAFHIILRPNVILASQS